MSLPNSSFTGSITSAGLLAALSASLSLAAAQVGYAAQVGPDGRVRYTAQECYKLDSGCTRHCKDPVPGAGDCPQLCDASLDNCLANPPLEPRPATTPSKPVDPGQVGETSASNPTTPTKPKGSAPVTSPKSNSR